MKYGRLLFFTEGKKCDGCKLFGAKMMCKEALRRQQYVTELSYSSFIEILLDVHTNFIHNGQSCSFFAGRMVLFFFCGF